ncbi:unnamed protein product (macronuclear) [Paramecium tetraurelia]|uniref:Uncharacterized protein n=1 Tax=Paramecium tetraurelia TaxID=5888 RepID=A0CYE3_PARTE|nr:uncharacterized protein GSPATT00011410001 [Paramecium tetraurelia]CAK75810.1 unnamed protein product [Paramecium tetraurelia]|eukprot:XP_001443207.1 hypothetical protein (macronuclear) [Paramecium tetraurelia strain d4-2]
MKKHNKPRQDEENKILEYLSKITPLNLPERIYIYKFCQTIIKLSKPDANSKIQLKDTKDLLLMFKSYFMAENNVEILQQIQQLMIDQEFKVYYFISIADGFSLSLNKILVNKSREDFHNLIQTTSTIVISKIKAKLSQQQQYQNKNQPIYRNQNQMKVLKLSYGYRGNAVNNENNKTLQFPQKPTIIIRSASMIDNLLVEQSQYQSYQQQLMQQHQQMYINQKRELKLQLRAKQKKLKKRLHSNYKLIMQIDFDHIWAMHIILKKNLSSILINIFYIGVDFTFGVN